MSFFFNQPDPKRRRFPIPNDVWKWELKPQGFAILAYLCYLHVHCNKNALPSADEIASQLHMSKDMAVKQIAELNRLGLLDQHMVPMLESSSKKFFSLPNELFFLNIGHGAITVYAYLLYCENRRTHQCHPSYRTISKAVHLTVANIIHHALRTAAENGLLPANPAEAVTPPKVVSQAKKILNHDQLDTFKAAVKQDWIWRDFFLTELTTGLRRGELCGLKWSDFDEEAGTLNVCRTIHARKGGGVEEGTTKTYAGTRTILLPSSTAQLLRERKKSALTEWIFPDLLCPEKPVSPGSAYRRLKGLLEEAGLPDLRFHDLRHTFATHALASGVDAKTLSGILGHTKASFTLDTYTHMTGDMHRNAAEIVGGFMTELLGEEMEPWRSSESGETVVST